jgi:hypothetical protein
LEEGTIDPYNRELFWYAETAAEIWSGIQACHEFGQLGKLGGSADQSAEPPSGEARVVDELD